MLTVDGRHLPDGSWRFDAEVAEMFPDMLRRSVPLYETVQREAADVLLRRLVPGDVILDLGVAVGATVETLRSAGCPDGVRFVGYDSSEPMLERARVAIGSDPRVSLVGADLNNGLPSGAPPQIGAVVALLTLQFLRPDGRPPLLRAIAARCRPDATILLYEKVAADAWEAQYVERYHRLKAGNGYSPEEIEAKARSLDGVLMPSTVGENVAMLQAAGFVDVQPWLGWYNFQGWIARYPGPKEG